MIVKFNFFFRQIYLVYSSIKFWVYMFYNWNIIVVENDRGVSG